MKNIDVSVIIPAYNEETNIRLGAIDKVLRYLEKQRFSWEMLIVDDGSTDKTLQLLKEIVQNSSGIRLIENPHQGKAATVMTGMMAASGKIVLFTDLDQATPISEFDKIYSWFGKGYDVVIGSRNKQREGAPLSRRIMALGFMIVRSVILGLKGITDTQCGFKAFRREVARTIFPKLKRYGAVHKTTGANVTAGFDIEVLFLAKIHGYKLKEVPVEWHYVETRRVNPIRDSWFGFLDILAIRLNALRGEYN